MDIKKILLYTFLIILFILTFYIPTFVSNILILWGILGVFYEGIKSYSDKKVFSIFCFLLSFTLTIYLLKKLSII